MRKLANVYDTVKILNFLVFNRLPSSILARISNIWSPGTVQDNFGGPGTQPGSGPL